MKLIEFDPVFFHPFTCIIAGPSGCGKSTFVTELLRKATSLIDPPPQRIVWFYGEWQPLYESLKGIEFVEGLPDSTIFNPKTNNLIIIDDLMAETNDKVTELFTKKSHHCNLSVIYIIQNVFSKGKENRTISLNANYTVLFKNPRDGSQVIHFAKQMFPHHTKYMEEAFHDATSEPYRYLMCDCKQTTPDAVRLRTQVLTPGFQFTYLKKDKYKRNQCDKSVASKT